MHIGDFLWARSGSLRAHKTQVDEREPFWFGLSDEELAEVYPYEDWVLARTLVPNSRRDGEFEDDMFAGIRAAVPR
ncbi:MAG: putative mycothiol conjugate amidase [Actinomycetota bacterium]